jgi:hypothetical protein
MKINFRPEKALDVTINEDGYINLGQMITDQNYVEIEISPHQAIRLANNLQDMAVMALTERYVEITFPDPGLAKSKIKIGDKK